MTDFLNKVLVLTLKQIVNLGTENLVSGKGPCLRSSEVTLSQNNIKTKSSNDFLKSGLKIITRFSHSNLQQGQVEPH